MTTKKAPTLIAALAALAGSGQAQEQDVASLHQFNLLAEINDNFRVMLHNRVRFYNDISEFLQYWTGPVLFYDWKPRLQWQAGYYVIEQRSNDTFVTIQRPWLGASVTAYGNDKLKLDWRTLAERHIYSGHGDFTRVRTRAMANFLTKSG